LGLGEDVGTPRTSASLIVAKLRQVDVLLSQGRLVGEAIRSVGVTQFTYYRWRKECGGLKGNQVKCLRELEKTNGRLRKAVSDLTLDKLILRLPRETYGEHRDRIDSDAKKPGQAT
jgi:hypothetical protein